MARGRQRRDERLVMLRVLKSSTQDPRTLLSLVSVGREARDELALTW